MRDIRFRGWSKLFKCMHSHEDLMEDDEFTYRVAFEPAETFVLMQYTGLDDKNGKPIFEGDICKFYYAYEDYNIESIGEIQYIGDGFKIDYNSVDLEAYFEIADVLWKDKMNKYRVFEVIGNIYEDAHLLDKHT